MIAAHRDEPVRTGTEEMIGAGAEVAHRARPDGPGLDRGTLWRARLAGGGGRSLPGDRVRVEAVDGLTLMVGPRRQSEIPAEEGAG